MKIQMKMIETKARGREEAREFALRNCTSDAMEVRDANINTRAFVNQGDLGRVVHESRFDTATYGPHRA